MIVALKYSHTSSSQDGGGQVLLQVDTIPMLWNKLGRCLSIITGNASITVCVVFFKLD